MSRANPNTMESDEGMPGEDSFLDIVANIVGILIILVMVVGVRASQGSLIAKPAAETDVHEVSYEAATKATSTDSMKRTASEPDQVEREAKGSDAEELSQLRRAIAFADRENAEQAARTMEVIQERALLEAERQKLVAMQALHEQDQAARRAQLDERKQEEFDIQKDLLRTKIELQKLTEQQYALVGQEEESEEIVCMPTPLAKEVEDAVFVRLRYGKLAMIPYEELEAEMRSSRLPYLQQGVRQRGQAQDTVGPIRGFRMRASIERRAEDPLTVTPLMARSTVTSRLVVEFLPVSEDIGQVAEQALLPNSEFSRRINRRRSTTESVVAFVYPDAYDDLRLLKRHLWEAGIPLAVFPLPEDQNIVFSSNGVKAAAQ